MKLSDIFSVFSRREEVAAVRDVTIPESTRNRVLLWCSDVFGNQRDCFGEDHRPEFWDEIHRALQFRHGKAQLVDARAANSPANDALLFLLDCDTAEYLDFLEYIFRVDVLREVRLSGDEMVAELNGLLRIDDLPLYLTGFATETTMEPSPFGGGREMPCTRVTAYPAVIARENEQLHQSITRPTLSLLTDARFAAANTEYLEAQEDYRKGDYGDCLTKCCSSFESVMKVICAVRKWPYNQNDTAGALIKTILDRTDLDAYFETTLLIVATLRNRLSNSHGAGTQPRQVSARLAAYALNCTGSAMLLLASETGLQ